MEFSARLQSMAEGPKVVRYSATIFGLGKNLLETWRRIANYAVYALPIFLNKIAIFCRPFLIF